MPEIMEKGIGIAVIGCGCWGPNLVRIFSSMPGCGEVRVWDIIRERMEAAARCNPGTRKVRSLQEILDDQNMDAVAIATPPGAHYEIAKKALLSGKHVFVEKPMTLSVAHARALTASARKQKKILMSGHVFLYNPAVAGIADMVGQGAIGKLRRLEFFRAGSRRACFCGPGTNVLWDLASHDISIALHLTGKMPKSVAAETRPPRCSGWDGWGRLKLYFPGGMEVTITASWFSPFKIRFAVVSGSSGAIIYDDTRQDFPLRLHSRSRSHEPKVRATEPLALECREFMDAIRTGIVPVSSGDFGLKVVKILEAADISARARGKMTAVE
ncbi:MAG: Gfo/Idh/MocA family oxidoreductase [bacterium]